jgi:gluconolactonase
MNPALPIEAFEIFAADLDHPEGLAFDRSGNLWAGGEAGQVYRIDPNGRVTLAANLGGFCAGLAFSPDDELFVCNPHLGIVHVQPSGGFSVFASHAGDQKITCPNFGLFDSSGNYYLTDSGNWKKQDGFLLRFRPGGTGEILGGPFGYLNGLALSADEKFLFAVESDTDRVLRFEIRAGGSLGPPENYAVRVGRFPDGLALDLEGNLYVGCYASDDIHRISPAREQWLFAADANAILINRPTNLAFGGRNFDQLYVANFGRTTVTRAKVGRPGQPLVNLKGTRHAAA